ncbi:MAG: isoprenylcysteine carboxylmethyltransferase family protein [Bacteriovoracia bacterium]
MSKESTEKNPLPLSAKLNAWYRGSIRGKTRITLAWIFCILLVLSARDYPAWPGIAVCFVGACIRFWASGYLRKDMKLSVGGPYGFSRNPLYLGTYIMALGTAIAVQNVWLVLAVSVLFAAVYHYIILDEETKLRGIFGSPYELYCMLVPRFFPRLSPPKLEEKLKVNANPEHHRFSWELIAKNRAHEPFATFAALIGFIYLIARVWKVFGA